MIQKINFNLKKETRKTVYMVIIKNTNHNGFFKEKKRGKKKQWKKDLILYLLNV